MTHFPGRRGARTVGRQPALLAVVLAAAALLSADAALAHAVTLGDKGYTLRYDEALVDYLVEKSYSLTYGARNLRRLIQKELEDPMAARIIDAFEHPITQISATVRDGAVQLYTL